MKRFILASVFSFAASAVAPSFALTLADHIGEAASPQVAGRTLEVGPGTRYLNVRSGETVNLQFNGTTTGWAFTGIDPMVTLNRIIPGAPEVNVYVDRANNRYAP
jgi:hypothetical protein